MIWAWAMWAACVGSEDPVPTLLQDVHNYVFDSEIVAETVAVGVELDAELDWTGVSRDILGREINPTEVDYVMVVRFDALESAEVLRAIAVDQLPQSELYGAWDGTPVDGETTLSFADMFVAGLGTAADVTTMLAHDSTFLVALFGDGGEQLRTLTLLEADSAEENAQVLLGDQSASIEYEISFGTTPAAVEQGGVDWAGIQHDTHGYAARLPLLDSLVLTRYESPLSELEGNFLEFESLAAESWEADITGLAGRLEWSELLDAEGASFAGFDEAEGAWLLALQCSTCFNPAPPFLAILEP